MMKTLSFFLLLNNFNSALAEVTPATVAFEARDPLLILVRKSQLVWPASPGFNCKQASKGLGTILNEGVWTDENSTTFGPWNPYKEEDLEAVQECDDFPCDVKLNRAETDRMKAKKENERQAEFFALVRERVGRYLKTQERKEFEFEGDPVDPWQIQDRELKFTTLKRPAIISLRVRKIVLLEKKARNIRQVLDRRFAESSQAKTSHATLWIRDVYSAHYFDSWGEIHSLDCDETARTLTLSQQLILEFDLLKKTDLISRISRPSMRKNIRDYGDKYLVDLQAQLVSSF